MKTLKEIFGGKPAGQRGTATLHGKLYGHPVAVTLDFTVPNNAADLSDGEQVRTLLDHTWHAAFGHDREVGMHDDIREVEVEVTGEYDADAHAAAEAEVAQWVKAEKARLEREQAQLLAQTIGQRKPDPGDGPGGFGI